MKALGLNVLMIMFALNFCYSSDVRINSLGGSPIYWQDDDEILNLFPNRLSEFSLFQISNINPPYSSENFKYIWGTENKFGLFSEQEKGISFLYVKNNFGLKTDIKFSLISQDSTFTEMIEAIDTVTQVIDTLSQTTSIKSKSNDVLWGLNFNFNDMSLQTTSRSNGLFDIRFNILKQMNSFGFENLYSSLFYSKDSLDNKMGGWSISIFRHFKNIPKLDILFSVSSDFIVKYNEDIGSLDLTQTILELNLPKFTLALESEIRDWLVYRMGINKSFDYISINTEYKENEINYNITNIQWIEKDIDVKFGLGFQFKGFLVDVGIDGEVFRNPIQKVVGFDELGTNTTATITYSW